jgi:hypothetical protein
MTTVKPFEGSGYLYHNPSRVCPKLFFDCETLKPQPFKGLVVDSKLRIL